VGTMWRRWGMGLDLNKSGRADEGWSCGGDFVLRVWL